MSSKFIIEISRKQHLNNSSEELKVYNLCKYYKEKSILLSPLWICQNKDCWGLNYSITCIYRRYWV